MERKHKVIIEVGTGRPAKRIEFLRIDDDEVVISFKNPKDPHMPESSTLLTEEAIQRIIDLLKKESSTPRS